MVKRSIPKSGFLRLKQIIGCPKSGQTAIIPVSKSTWWAGVKSGNYPKPYKLSSRCTAWKAEEIMSLIESIEFEAN